MKKKTALIFGITGQDGSYLAELLLKKNYIVNGVKRRSSSINTSRVDHIYQDPHEKNYRFRLHYGDITDSLSVTRIIKQVKPDEIYNLAAQSHVAVSFESSFAFSWCQAIQIHWGRSQVVAITTCLMSICPLDPWFSERLA